MYLRSLCLMLATSAMLSAVCKSADANSTSSSTTPDGTYYSAWEDLGDGRISPETLLVLNEGVITQYTVHNDAVLIIENEYSLSGNLIFTTSRETEAYDCNGLAVTMEAEGSLDGVEFRKTGDNLEIIFEGETLTLFGANQDDVERIVDLPACIKQ